MKIEKLSVLIIKSLFTGRRLLVSLVVIAIFTGLCFLIKFDKITCLIFGIGIVCFVSFCITFFYLLRKSDKDFILREYRMQRWQEPLTTIDDFAVKVEVREGAELKSYGHIITFEIKLRNVIDYEINKVIGKINFYDKDCIVHSIDFDVSNLLPRKSIQIFNGKIESKGMRYWNSFDVLIKEINYYQCSKENIRIRSESLAINVARILDEKYIKAFNTLYEIRWLLDIKERIINMLRFYWKRRFCFGNRIEILYTKIGAIAAIVIGLFIGTFSLFSVYFVVFKMVALVISIL